MRERRRLVSTHVDARARRGRASHSPASPFLAAPRQRDGGWFCLGRRTGAAGAGVLRTAPPPPFWLRRVSETAAGFYMRRLTHGCCGGGGVLRTAPPPPVLGCAASKRRRLLSTCVDARARWGRASRFAHHRLPLIRCAASARRRLASTRVDARARRGRASHSPASPGFGLCRVIETAAGSTCVDARARRGRACLAQPCLSLFGCAASARRRLVSTCVD